MAANVWRLVLVFVLFEVSFGRIVNKRKCPEVRAVPHFDLPKMLGDWYVVEYYASAEEALSYSCMKAVFTEDDHVQGADGTVEWTPGVTMNFTYRFADDPLGENLLGNITWRVDLNEPAHWTHSEITYDGIYNTYVLDTEYKTWALLLHCAEQREGARYLSAFVLSRNTVLPKNVMAYLRDKLPRYDVDIKYVFPIPHDDCSSKPARADYSPILVEVGSKVPKRPGVSYNVAFGH
ncbi:apolipoprotein D [Epargyreus clarus]|uniref:apolipoprotein D n=1 Tax=Epargyreus clarus TaxID=520877 RepID=UPI003C2F9BC0